MSHTIYPLPLQLSDYTAEDAARVFGGDGRSVTSALRRIVLVCSSDAEQDSTEVTPVQKSDKNVA
jgi:uncharacterized hydantoinase/oxoprolinase family protein